MTLAESSPPPQPTYEGTNGDVYTVYPVETFYNGTQGLRDTFVSNERAEKFYVAHKNPEIQLAAYSMGEHVASKDPALSRLQFPSVKKETLHDQPVALVEYLEGYKELKGMEDSQHILTAPERAFIGVYTLFIGNRDMKAAHVLVSPGADKRIGLIDMDRAFQYEGLDTEDVRGRLQRLGEMPPRELIMHYYALFKESSGELRTIAAGSGGGSERAVHAALARLEQGEFARLIEDVYGFDPSNFEPHRALGASAINRL